MLFPFFSPPREEMGRKKIKILQKQLSDVKKEKEFELQVWLRQSSL